MPVSRVAQNMFGMRTLAPHFQVLALVVALSLPIALYSPLTTPTEFRGGSDFTINRAIQKSLAQPALYPTDVNLQVMRPNYLPMYSKAMAATISIFPSDAAAYLTISLVLWVLLLTGMYAFAAHVTLSRTIGAIAALSCAFGYRAFNGNLWGIQLGQVLPRDLFVLLAPWACLALLHWQHKSWRLVLFFALGLLANIHLLEAYYLIGFCLLWQLFLLQPWTQAQRMVWWQLLGAAVLALIGSLPIILRYLTSPRSALSLDLLHYRMPYLFTLSFPAAAWWLLAPALLAVLGWGILPPNRRKFFSMAILAAAVLSIGGFLAAQLFPKLLLLQFDRASRLLYLGLLPLAAACIPPLLAASFQRRMLGAAIVALLMVPLPLQAGVLSIPLPTPQRQELDAAIALSPADDAASSIAVAEWARSTSLDALFLAPPYSFADWFRVTAERSIVTSFKDGANMIITQPDGGKAWYDRYAAVRDVYLQNSTAAFVEAAERYGASHIVVDRSQHQLDLSMVFENAKFAIYATGYSGGE